MPNFIRCLLIPPGARLELPVEDLVVSLNYAKRLARCAHPEVPEAEIGSAQEMSVVVYAEPVAGAPLDLIEMLHEVREK